LDSTNTAPRSNGLKKDPDHPIKKPNPIGSMKKPDLFLFNSAESLYNISTQRIIFIA